MSPGKGETRVCGYIHKFFVSSCSYLTVCSIFSAFMHHFSVFWFPLPILQQFNPVAGSAFFQQVLFAFFGHNIQQAMVCRCWLNGHLNSVICILFKHTFCSLWIGNSLLNKYFIRLQFFYGFWGSFLVLYFFQFNCFIFTLSSVNILKSQYTPTICFTLVWSSNIASGMKTSLNY